MRPVPSGGTRSSASMDSPRYVALVALHSSFPNSVLERTCHGESVQLEDLSAKLSFAAGRGNRVSKTMSFPNSVWERESNAALRAMDSSWRVAPRQSS